eukprot:2122117-Alexandrium_andersonii.AAC.1
MQQTSDERCKWHVPHFAVLMQASNVVGCSVLELLRRGLSVREVRGCIKQHAGELALPDMPEIC